MVNKAKLQLRLGLSLENSKQFYSCFSKQVNSSDEILELITSAAQLTAYHLGRGELQLPGEICLEHFITDNTIVISSKMGIQKYMTPWISFDLL